MFFLVSEPTQVGDSLVSEAFMLDSFPWMNQTYSGFYCQCGTIGHNELLYPSVSLGGSWLQMLFSLSPIISCLIEDNITRQWGPAHHSASMACSLDRASLLKVGVAAGGVVCVCMDTWTCSSLLNLDQEDGQLKYSSRGGCSYWSASPLHGPPTLVNAPGCVWVMRLRADWVCKR